MASDAGDIRLGLAGGFAALGKHRKPAFALHHAEEEAGVNGLGRRLEALCQQAPTVLLAPIGPIAVAQLMQSGVLERNDTLLINPIPGAESFRRPAHPRVLHVRASDTDQVGRIIHHATIIGITRLALITENDGSPAAQSIWVTAQAVAARIGNIEVRHVSVASPTDAPRALKQQDFSPQAVLAAGPPQFMAIALNEVRKLAPGTHTYALSYLTPEVAVQVLGEKARGISIAQVYPSLSKGHLPFVKSFREAMHQVAPASLKLNAYHVEGYVVARLVARALLSTWVPTAAGFAAALRASGKIDLSGFEVDFSTSSEGSRFVEMGVIDSGGTLRA